MLINMNQSQKDDLSNLYNYQWFPLHHSTRDLPTAESMDDEMIDMFLSEPLALQSLEARSSHDHVL